MTSTITSRIRRPKKLWKGYRDPGGCFWSEPPGPLAVTIDWRVLTMFDSHTSHQFGTAPQLGGPQYAPVSKLDWSLDSTWTGFRLGLEEVDSATHIEWLTPMAECISGGMYDYDWNINDPRNDPDCASIACHVRRNDGTKGKCLMLNTSSGC